MFADALVAFTRANEILKTLADWDTLAFALASDKEVTVTFDVPTRRLQFTAVDGTPCWIKVGR